MKQANFRQKLCVRIILRTLLLLVVFPFTQMICAQVTIGSGIPPHDKALLDLKERADGTADKGLILPRVSLLSAVDYLGISSHEKGTIVYNINLSDSQVPVEDRVSAGFYYNNGSRWEKLHLGYTNWFYMPSIPIDISNDATGATIDLYSEYKKQFDGTGTTFVASAGAPGVVPFRPAKSDFYYYVTYYDTTIFNNVNIDADGVMTYDVTAAATDQSLINILFVLK